MGCRCLEFSSHISPIRIRSKKNMVYKVLPGEAKPLVANGLHGLAMCFLWKSHYNVGDLSPRDLTRVSLVTVGEKAQWVKGATNV